MKIKDQFIPLIGYSLILATSLVWLYIKAKLVASKVSIEELIILVCVALLLYILLLWLLTWFHIKPKQILAEHTQGYENLYLRIKATVDKLIQKQRFIDQDILNVIEREADDIWVITTKLENELKNEELRKSVEDNLAEGKHYTYFLPHPNEVYFESIEKNLKAFKSLNLYKHYQGQIEIIRLPLDTQFLLDEVVIYNPDKPENPSNSAHGITGFTYYECRDDPDAVGPLHMKIEGHLLMFLSNKLTRVRQNIGLKSAIDRIFIEFADNLEQIDKAYLVDIYRFRIIDKKDAYDEFIKRVSARSGAKDKAKIIDQILRKYLEI